MYCTYFVSGTFYFPNKSSTTAASDFGFLKSPEWYDQMVYPCGQEVNAEEEGGAGAQQEARRKAGRTHA